MAVPLLLRTVTHSGKRGEDTMQLSRAIIPILAALMVATAAPQRLAEMSTS